MVVPKALFDVGHILWPFTRKNRSLKRHNPDRDFESHPSTPQGSVSEPAPGWYFSINEYGPDVKYEQRSASGGWWVGARENAKQWRHTESQVPLRT